MAFQAANIMLRTAAEARIDVQKQNNRGSFRTECRVTWMARPFVSLSTCEVASSGESRRALPANSAKCYSRTSFALMPAWIQGRNGHPELPPQSPRPSASGRADRPARCLRCDENRERDQPSDTKTTISGSARDGECPINLSFFGRLPVKHYRTGKTRSSLRDYSSHVRLPSARPKYRVLGAKHPVDRETNRYLPCVTQCASAARGVQTADAEW